MRTAAAARDVLAGIVGNAHTREAAAEDAVAGVEPALVVEPADEEQVAAVLACASRDGLTVVVRGGGTQLDRTPPPRRCDVVLSTLRLDAMVEHEPGDLVCVVQAGMRLTALHASVGRHGQRLALDPGAGVAATLGGIAATAGYGPPRTRHGSMRDAVLGARFVLSDGTVAHSGGKVVKNVAGYDVARLLLGSQGTLAVITQLALRLHPLPHSSRTLRMDGLDAASIERLSRAVDSPAIAPAALAALWPEGALLVRVEGGDAGVSAQTAALRDAVQPAAVLALDADDDAQAWDELRSAAWRAPAAPVATVGVKRTDVAALLERLGGMAERCTVLPSLGLADARLLRDVTAADVQSLRTWAQARGGHVVIRRPTAALAGVAWPASDGAAFDLMRSLKHALDPTATLAPGRYLGGI